jgi:hypothetical protein
MTTNRINLPAGRESARDSFDYSLLTERLMLAAGIAFVVLLFVTIADAPEPPSAWALDSRLSEWLAAHHDIFLTNAYLRSVAAFLMLIFICGVVGRVRRLESRTGTASLLAVCGAVIFTLLMFVSQVADATALLLASSGGDEATVRSLAALGDTMRHFNSFSVALMTGAVSAAVLSARAVPRFVGWFGLISVPVFLAGAAGFPETRLEFINSTVALPLLSLWPLVLSLTLLLRRSGESRAHEPSHD